MEDGVLINIDMPEEVADQLKLQRFECVANIGEIAAVYAAPIHEVRATCSAHPLHVRLDKSTRRSKAMKAILASRTRAGDPRRLALLCSFGLHFFSPVEPFEEGRDHSQ